MVLPPPQKKKMVSPPSKVLNTNKNSESVHFYNIMVAQQAGGDFDVIDGDDLDGNDSSVEDASDMDSDVEKCQIESLIKKYS